MQTRSEWIDLQFDHPMLQDAEVRRVIYQGELGQPEQIQMWIYSAYSRVEMRDQLLGKMASFRLIDLESTVYFSHWLAEIKWLVGQELAGRQYYVLTWRAPIARLAQTQLSLVLQKINMREALQLILSGSLISKNPRQLQVYDLQMTGDIDSLQPPLKAYQSSLMDFFKQILARRGWTYFFDHSQPDCPLIITDSIANSGPEIAVVEFNYAVDDLLTKPFIERFKWQCNAVSALFQSTGHPDRDPQVLLEETQAVPEGFAAFHATFSGRTIQEVANDVQWISEYRAGEADRQFYQGGGLIFAGQVMAAQEAFLVGASWTLELDGAVKNRIKHIQTYFDVQPLGLPYREEIALYPKQVLMAGHVIAEDAVTIDAMGHYQVNVPAYFVQNNPQPLAATRMLYPLQSDDHGHHYTLMPGAEVLVLWSGNYAGQSLILGTVNSVDSPHLTQQQHYQNAYWQDDSGNRIGFINEGQYDPTQTTGRKTAHILETPTYHPDGSSNYLRMGDAVQNDGEYPSQAAEPGILGVTEGHYHERHAGGLMELMGNMGSDPNQPIPAMRQRVQINPSLGAPHILNTVNAHEHAVDLSSAQVVENKTLTTDTLTHTLAAPDYFVTHAQDESRGIYINQVHAQTGTNNLLKVNTLCLSTTAQSRSLRQAGLQRRDQYQNKILNLNHSQNNLQYETLTQSIGLHNKQTSVEAMSVQNYTRTHQQSTQQASSIIQQNNSWQSDVSQTYFGDSMNMHSGSASLLAPDSVVMLNECFIQATQSGSSSEGLLSSRE